MEKYSLWLWKKPGKLGEFFLLLCGHPVTKKSKDTIIVDTSVGNRIDHSLNSSLTGTLAPPPNPQLPSQPQSIGQLQIIPASDNRNVCEQLNHDLHES